MTLNDKCDGIKISVSQGNVTEILKDHLGVIKLALYACFKSEKRTFQAMKSVFNGIKVLITHCVIIALIPLKKRLSYDSTIFICHLSTPYVSKVRPWRTDVYRQIW